MDKDIIIKAALAEYDKALAKHPNSTSDAKVLGEEVMEMMVWMREYARHKAKGGIYDATYAARIEQELLREGAQVIAMVIRYLLERPEAENEDVIALFVLAGEVAEAYEDRRQGKDRKYQLLGALNELRDSAGKMAQAEAERLGIG